MRVENIAGTWRSVPVDDFPPEEQHSIFEDGGTNPINLAELVQERVVQGWEPDQELLRRLKLTPAE